MAKTGFFHHVGTFLLFAATILLLVTCISSPVVNKLAILKVDLGDQDASDHGSITFGTFGYCVNGAGDEDDDCSKRSVGYAPADVVMSEVHGTDFSDASRKSTKALTKVMVLHPVSCALNFIAFLMALGAGVVGSLLASMISLLAFVVTVVVMIIDFVLFGIIKSKVNGEDSDANAHYSAAAWTVLASAICSLLGTVVVFLTCCSARMHRRRDVKSSGTRRRWI